MRVPTAFILCLYLQFGLPTGASFVDVDVPASSHLLVDNELSSLYSQLNDVSLEEHERYGRSLDVHKRYRVKRALIDSDDYEHGFYPFTGVGNRQEFLITAIEPVPNTTIIDGAVSSWSYSESDRGRRMLITRSSDNTMLLLTLTLGIPNVFSVGSTLPAMALARFFEVSDWNEGHVVKTTLYMSRVDLANTLYYHDMVHDIVTMELFPLIDLQFFSIGMETYFAVLAPDTFVHFYRWSTRYNNFSPYLKITIPQQPSSMQVFVINDKTYLLVAVKDENSVLFRFHQSTKSFRQYQLLYPDGAKDVLYFSNAYEHYVVFISQMGFESTFFHWTGFKFVVLQTIETIEANHWYPMPVPGLHDHTLLVLTSNRANSHVKPITLFRYRHLLGKFEKLDNRTVIDTLNPPEFINASRVMSFQDGNDVYIMLAVSKSQSNVNNLFKLTILNIDNEDPVVLENQELVETLNNLDQQLTQQENRLDVVNGSIDNAVTIDTKQTIHKNVSFNYVKMDNVWTRYLETVDVNITSPKPTDNTSLSYISNVTDEQRQTVEDWAELMNDTVTLNTTQTITSLKNITTVTIQGALNSTTFETILFDDVDIAELNRQAFRLDALNQVIDGSLQFTGNLTSHASIHLDDGYRVNTLDLSDDVVLKFGDQNITGPKTFAVDVMMDELLLSGSALLNGFDPSVQFVTLGGTHTLTGSLIFTDVMYVNGNITTNGLLDTVNVASLCSDVMTQCTPQTILGNLTFSVPPLFDTDVVYNGLLTGVNITDLNERAVRINRDTTITGDKKFSDDVAIVGNLSIGGNLNSFNLLTDVVQLAQVNGSLAGARVFTGTVEVDGPVEVRGTVNGINFGEDVVTLTGDHNITGYKTFQDGIDASEDIIVTGDVDTVDLSTWASEVMTISTDQTIQGPILFLDPTTIDANLSVRALINGIDIQELFDDTFFNVSNLDQEITGVKFFNNTVTVNDAGWIVMEGLINGDNMTEDYLNDYSDQTISELKTFRDGFTADDDLSVSGLISGIDLISLYNNSLLIGHPANLSGERTFTGHVHIEGAVTITGNVDGIKIATDVLTTSGDQTVEGVKIFQNLSTASMSCGDLTVGMVNQKNWTDFVLTRVDLSSPQNISTNLSIDAGEVEVGDVNILGTVNTVDLVALLKDIMRSTILQTVTGNKTLKAMTVYGDVTLDERINNVNLSDFVQRAMRLTGPQVITGQMVFMDETTLLDTLTVGALLDGVDLDFFMSDIIDDTTVAKITGTKAFSDGFHTENNVDVVSLVDGLDLSEDVMTTNTDQTVTGDWTISETVVILANNSIVDGLLNGIDLVSFNNSILKIVGDQTVNSELIFLNDLTSTTDVTVTLYVDGYDISELDFKAVKLDEPFDITDNLNFTQGVTFDGYMNATGLIYGLNISEWYQTVVLLNTNETVLGNKTFAGDVTVAGDLTVVNDMIAQTVFSQDFQDFLDDVVFAIGDANITGAKIFKDTLTAVGSVIVNGLTDGIDTQDIVTLSGNDVITGVKTFVGSLMVNDNITLSGLINNVDLYDVYSRSFKLNNYSVVLATKSFSENLTMDGDVFVGGFVDGVDLDAEAVTLGTEQTINASLFFNLETTFDGSVAVAGEVGGVTLSNLTNHRATLSDFNTVNGVLTFQGHVVINEDVFLLGLFDEITPSVLWAQHEALMAWVWQDIEDVHEVSDAQCQDVTRLQKAYANTVGSLSYISEVQVLDFRIESFEAFEMDDVSHLALAVHSSNVHDLCVDSYIYSWNSTSLTFFPMATIPSNGANSWHAFENHDVHYLVLGNEGSTPCYGEAAVTNPVFMYNGSHFVELQQLDSWETQELDSTQIGRGPEEQLHLVVAHGKTTAPSIVYVQESNGTFTEVQRFSIGGATSVKFVHVRNETFLAFSAVNPTQSPVYIFNASTRQFDIHQYITTWYAQAVDTFMFRGQVGLLFANHAERLPNNEISYNVPISMYYWNENSRQFELEELVTVNKGVDVDAFFIGPDLYLAVVCEFKKMELFRYEGVSGFTNVLTFDTYGVVSVEVFEIPDLPPVESLFFAVAVDPVTHDVVSSRILQARTIGDSVDLMPHSCDVEARNKFYGDESLLD